MSLVAERTPAAGATAHRPYRMADVLLSEWSKIRTLRSTMYTLLATVALGVGLSLLFSGASAAGYKVATPAEQALFDPTAASVRSCIIAQLAIGVLGVLVVTSEYATRMMRTSVTAVPRRGRLLAAKALVFSVVALLVGQVVGFAAFYLGQLALATEHVPHAALSQPGVFRAVTGCGLYLAAIGLLGIGLGTIVRATAGAISVLVAITLLIPVLSTMLPDSWATGFQKWWPTNAGGRLATVLPNHDLLSPWTGFGVLVVFVATVVAIAFTMFHFRDV
jgi:hypothetical protein